MGFRYYDPRFGVWVDAPGDQPVEGGLGFPTTPSSQVPRKVRDLAKRPLLETVLMAQAVIGLNAVFTGLYAQRSAETFGVTGGSNVNVSNIRWRQFARSGSGTKDGFGQHFGSATFHHILDPTGGLARWSLIFHDLIRVDFNSGNGWVAVGFVNANTSNDETTFVGAMWKCSSADGYWRSGVYDGTGTSNTLHETSHTGLTVSTPRRLSVVIDAASKSVLWYADYALVDSFTPSSPIGQMGVIPKLGWYGIANAGATVRFQGNGGGNPRLLVLMPAA